MLITSNLLAALLFVAFEGSTSFRPLKVHSVLEVSQQVVFSGRQPGGFRLKIHNTGPVPITITERQADGVMQERGRLGPHQAGALRFGTGAAAIVRNSNSTTRRAEFDTKISSKEADGLSVRYGSWSR